MKEIKTDSCVIRIYSPEVTKEKAAHRMKQIGTAAEKLLKAREKAHHERKN